ncbi:hypothetical protein Syun_023373 [Stephania yunnanensis]|uniref:Xylanase inhibitor N-terminal domain-containing protein n=1 Tax=Stephania yunnanensis TaxID=152371 RepID=A0AAP0FC20_9MAGN
MHTWHPHRVASASICCSLNVFACRNNSCLYQVSYGDGSYTIGDCISETQTFNDDASVDNIAIGCGHNIEGLFVGAAGVYKGVRDMFRGVRGVAGGWKGGAVRHVLRSESAGECERAYVELAFRWAKSVRLPARNYLVLKVPTINMSINLK